MKILIITNDPPYGTERSYNALRIALELVKRDEVEVRVFLLADAVFCGIRGQTTPDGYYNTEQMLKGLRRAQIKACGGCMEARGLTQEDLLAEIVPSNMAELGDWITTSDKIISL